MSMESDLADVLIRDTWGSTYVFSFVDRRNSKFLKSLYRLFKKCMQEIIWYLLILGGKEILV